MYSSIWDLGIRILDFRFRISDLKYTEDRKQDSEDRRMKEEGFSITDLKNCEKMRDESILD